MAHRIGIRREDKNIWERRVPLTPRHVGELARQGIPVAVQPSDIRAFSDDAYRQAGADVTEDLSDCPIVFAVKEIPIPFFRPGGAYVYFAHVIKGQPYNMPMLAKLLELGCTLIDYERVVDDKNRRLVFFGRHAGLAGMIDSLWALGKRLTREGHETAFASIEPAHAYENLEAAKQAVARAGEQLAKDGLPDALVPAVFGFAGYGNVSRGAQEVFDLLPHTEITPDELLATGGGNSRHELVKTVFYEKHMVRPRQAGHAFDLQDYYDHPERYEGDFARFAPHLTVLVNCIYWTQKYPRLLSRKTLQDLWAGGTPRLRVIGDVSCDVEGAVACTLKCTGTGDPVFVYRVEDDRAVMGTDEDPASGPVVLAVDNLPCELPVESSGDFGDALMPYVPALAEADLSKPFAELGLPAPLKRAVITHRGELTPEYGYLKEKLESPHGGPS